MNSKRSYLDTLNAGRQRKVHASIEQLNRTLELLEQRIERPARTNERGSDRVTDRSAYANSTSRNIGRDAYAARDEAPYARPAARASAPEPTYQSLTRDIERVRSQEDGMEAAGKIAGELKSLREDLRHQMTAGLQREFEALRKDIERAYSSAHTTTAGSEIGVEFERLSDAIRSLSERSDDKSINLLRLDLEQVKGALDTLARDESVRSSDLDRRWTKFEDRYKSGPQSLMADPAMGALHSRLEEINAAVNNLPELLSLRSMEEKVRLLAGAVDHFARQQDGIAAGSFGQIEERLNEISRAIVASTVSVTTPNFDPQPFERIEARISSLAHQIEELIEDQPGVEVIGRLNQLSLRVDELAAQGQLPEKAIEKLASQVAFIADRLLNTPAMPDADLILKGIEERFDILSDVFDRRQGDTIEHGQALFRDLERRLEELANRLEHQERTAPDNSGIMEAIDARFGDLARNLEARSAAAAPAISALEARLENMARVSPDNSGIMQAIDDRFRDLARKLEVRNAATVPQISTLEARLDDISAQLEASAAKVAGIDRGLIKSLEAQVAGLSAHLSRPNQPLPEFEDIGPRLSEIEKSISGSRDSILDAARQAAESAVKTLGGSGIEAAAAAGLAQDLKTLEQLNRRADERNTKTFEAIHDTLLKIVERLGHLEEDRAGRYARSEPDQPARKQALEHTPSIAPGIEAPLAGDVAFGKANADFAAHRSPAEAAAAAAVAALDGELPAAPEATGRVRSMLGGFTRAFSKKERVEPVLASAEPELMVEEKPMASLDQPLDPKIANRPLEPGSGAPDLSAIMRRVRDERGQPVRHSDTDTAKSDFIAAARRAAQAAAAEAEIAKRGSSSTGSGERSSLGSLFNVRRKPVLMAAAAILIALAGLQLGKAFLRGDPEAARIEPAPAIIEAPMATDSASMSSAEPEMPLEIIEPTDEVIDEPDVAAADSESAEPDPKAVRQAEPVTTTAAIEQAPEAAMPEEEIVAAAPPGPVSEPVPADAGPLQLREAADQGDPKALFEVGSRYAEGRGVKEDMAQAAKWYEKSADLGLAPAQYRIGNFYEKGIGVARDVDKAKTWYQMSAEQGNASAMHNLAVLYAMGADGTADNESAARWFIEAAELGVKDSQFNLGILSAKGVGMPQNLEESYKWFALVAKAGDKDAAAKRDDIANTLRPEQLVKARAATELWKAKPVKAEANTVEIPDAWRESTTTTASVDMQQAVRNIQLILNKNGYDAGSADGVMGAKTKTAIADFQKANGMEATGEIDEVLVKALLENK